jgi:hypothetical protein
VLSCRTELTYGPSWKRERERLTSGSDWDFKFEK